MKSLFLTLLLGLCGISPSKDAALSDHELQKSLAVAKAMQMEDMTFHYAYLTLKANGIRQSDCYICSASGFPTDPEAFLAKRPFSHYHISAVIISGREMGATAPVSISIPGGADERLTAEAKLMQLTENLYFAEFDLPSNILAPSGEFKYISMKCGDGKPKDYNLLYDFYGNGVYLPYLLPRGSNLP